MAQGTHVLRGVPTAPVSGELQPPTSARSGAGDDQGPPEPIVDRHSKIDNDGGRLENGPPASPQQIDKGIAIGENHENRKSDAVQSNAGWKAASGSPAR